MNYLLFYQNSKNEILKQWYLGQYIQENHGKVDPEYLEEYYKIQNSKQTSLSPKVKEMILFDPSKTEKNDLYLYKTPKIIRF